MLKISFPEHLQISANVNKIFFLRQNIKAEETKHYKYKPFNGRKKKTFFFPFFSANYIIATGTFPSFQRIQVRSLYNLYFTGKKQTEKINSCT